MNENSEIQKLLHKFILNQCTVEEVNEVVEYYRNNKLTSDFPEVEDIKSLLDEMPVMDEATADRIFSNILIKAKETEVIDIVSEKNPFRKYLGIAASILVLLTIGLSYQQGFFNSKEAPVLNGNEITLQLENGEIQVISAGKKFQITAAEGTVFG